MTLDDLEKVPEILGLPKDNILRMTIELLAPIAIRAKEHMKTGQSGTQLIDAIVKAEDAIKDIEVKYELVECTPDNTCFECGSNVTEGVCDNPLCGEEVH